MRKFAWKAVIVPLLVLAAISGCSRKSGERVVKVGLVGDEMEGAWKETVKLAEKENIKIELVYFSDYAVPNRALADGDIQLNSFQHDAFLRDEIQNHGYKIESFGNTVLFFMGVYSYKLRGLDELENGDTIVVMNDATNEGRALKVLEAAGVFSLDPAKGNLATPKDIISNPKNIKIVEVDAALAWPSLDDPEVAAAVVNSTFVVNAGAVPSRDAIFIKPIDPVGDKPYINIIVGRSVDRDDPFLRRIVELFHSDEVKNIVETEEPTAGIAVPAW